MDEQSPVSLYRPSAWLVRRRDLATAALLNFSRGLFTKAISTDRRAGIGSDAANW